MIATAVAADPGPAGVVLLAGPAKTGEQTVIWQARRIAPTLPRVARAVLRLLRTTPEEQQRKALRKITATDGDVARLQGVRVSATWFREFLAFDPVPLLARITVPVLAITGDKDLQVDPDDLDIIAATVTGPVTVERIDRSQPHPSPRSESADPGRLPATNAAARGSRRARGDRGLDHRSGRDHRSDGWVRDHGGGPRRRPPQAMRVATPVEPRTCRYGERMRVVIAGGHGKVGLRLARLLGEREAHPVGLVRKVEQEAELVAVGAHPEIFDLESGSAAELAEILSGADAVVFAAGAGPGSGAARKDTVDRGGAVLLADAAELAGVRRYVMVSAIGADDGPGPDHDEVYAAYVTAKKAADDDIRARDLDWTILRPGGLTTASGTGLVHSGRAHRTGPDLPGGRRRGASWRCSTNPEQRDCRSTWSAATLPSTRRSPAWSARIRRSSNQWLATVGSA